MKGLPVMVRAAALMLALPVCAAVVRADVKIKVKQTMAGHATEQTTYIKGKRRRTEMMGGAMTTIQQCDLRRDIQISDATKTYTVTHYAADDAAATATRTPVAGRSASQAGGAATRGGVVTTTMTSKDTGERKQMFGYTARRVITTMVTESSPDACSNTKTRMEVDGWYIDAAFAPDCDAGRTYQTYAPQQNAGCQDRYVTKQVGTAKTGYPLSTKTTIYGENGEASYTMLMETIEISQQATLDAALFDVPAGYREVKDASELYTGVGVSRGMSGDGETNENDDDDGDSDEPSGSGASAGSAGRQSNTAAPAVVGAKREGVVRLGLAAVKTGAVGDGMNAAHLAAAVQNTLAEHLRGPNVEVLVLDARLPAQVEAEARQKECDFVVYANVSHKKGGGGGFGKLLGAGASVAGDVAHVGGSTAGAVAAHAASTAVYTAASMSANVKAKDELTIDIRLQAPGGATPAVAQQFKAKAKSNGEDIISPLVEQAAQVIMNAAAASN